MPVNAANAGRSIPAGVAGYGKQFAPQLAFAGLIVIWEIGCRIFKVPEFLLPTPSMIVAGALQQPMSVWMTNTWATVRVALMGYALAIAVSIPVAIALASSKVLSRTFYPMIVVIHSTPIVAIAPIIVVTLGASDLPRVMITFLIIFFRSSYRRRPACWPYPKN